MVPRKSFAGISRHRESHALASGNAGDIDFRHGNHQTQTRILLQAEQRHSAGAWPDQRAGMDVPLGDDAVERSRHVQVAFHVA